MTDTDTQLIYQQLLAMHQTVNQLTLAVDSLSRQLTAVDNRLALVERCVINIHNEINQAPSRPVWTESERAAYCSWLASDNSSDDLLSTLPSTEGYKKF